ncbi:MAG TPA: cytochrome c oxidase subunit 4 [Candidatus Aquilonibacter sp.]|nr:cytochrome c oxidase subunit 4 [Candidatus Aquilonibacter sp.]
MKTFVGLFFSSTAFGLVILIAYWFVAHEETTGSIFLAVMTIALAFCAMYAVVAERNAHIDGDGQELTPEDTVGEDIGVFTTHTPYPILLALSVLFLLLGVVYSPLLATAAGIAAILCLWRLGAESARV